MATSAPLDVSGPPRLSLALYAAVCDGLHEGIYVLQDGVFRYVNRALAALAGGVPGDLVGRPMPYMVAPEDHEVVLARHRRRVAGEDVPDTYEFSVLCLDRVTRVPIFMHARALTTAEGPVTVGTIVPLAARGGLDGAAAEHSALHGHGDAGERLAIPVLQLHEHALVVPLVGHVSAVRAKLLMDHLLAAIGERRAREVILDITGVPVVDERVAAYFVRTARAVRLLGARFTLAGIAPAIARALVDAGVDLRDCPAAHTLQDAWRAAAARLAAA